MTFNIIIVGAGIAGLAAAIALRSDHHTITILEQSSQSREIGATISLQPNASKIVEQRWGLADRLREQGSMPDTAFEVYNLRGELQNRIPLVTSKYGADRMMYHRMDLHQVLKHRATADEYPGQAATLRVSSRVKRCDCEEGVVELENGEMLKGDLIIGADGIKSVIRGAVLGREVPGQTTGLSAYRMMLDTEELVAEKAFVDVIDPRVARTTMVVGPDRRLIMGPARNASVYSIVALVPDEKKDEESTSWMTAGDKGKMLATFADFPEWATTPLRLAAKKEEDIGLWQLRDLDPLETWCRGRAILIGDAAHAMLPTQGQGGSQAVEDAEALGAFFEGFVGGEGREEVERGCREVFECRYRRASTIQAYSRQTGRPVEEDVKVAMNPAEFMDYNCKYEGAMAWRRQQEAVVA
ncbi:hypothetical protein ASPBRDRAFT_111998 [Aspergillus brasiliensis CBS 101740]|uniref:FAD-binding domain-containing protein n=1 Tax=Aspergillus brasiliensis (strain CBS 101740 / IMI 381727 / IBT 21946) TaxID=767769 RepID=A0A1L9V1J3_ASPBC|nr:hypothetical protein ASPBRDRAFT_111998 [Aspergillus brasiliensis CBS 101740]